MSIVISGRISGCFIVLFKKEHNSANIRNVIFYLSVFTFGTYQLYVLVLVSTVQKDAEPRAHPAVRNQSIREPGV